MSDTITLTDEQHKYHIEEYKALKSELTDTFKASFQVVIFSVTANAAIISFLVSNRATFVSGNFGFFIRLTPFIVAFAAFAIYLLRRRSIGRITSYLYKLEDTLSANGLGWERSYASDIKTRKWFIRTPIALGTVMVIQIVYVLLFAVLA